MKLVTLGDYAEFNPRFRHSLGEDERVSFVPMGAVSEEDGSLVPGERPYGSIRKGYTAFADEDILVAKITPCFENGKIAHALLPTQVGFGSTEFHVVRPCREDLDTRYVFHFLRQSWVRREGERRMTGSAGQRRVPVHFLADLEIPLPPLPEQRRIASVLDRAEALRAARRAALAQLDQLTQAIFLEIFGDPRTNPKSWPTRSIEDLITAGPQNGLYKPNSEYGSGTPILRIDGFYDGRVMDLGSLKRVRISDEEQRVYGLCAGDIVVNRVNSMEYLGKSALTPVLREPTVFESNMMRFSVDRRQIAPEYLVQFLQTGLIKAQIQAAAKHAVNQSSINQQDVKGFQVRVPPIPLQHEFVVCAAAVERLKAAQRASLAELDALFASLQHRAFRGEL